MYYSIESISYVFPFGTRQHIYNRIGNSIYAQPDLYGVLAPCIGKKMSEMEADDLLCELIHGHPFMKDAMHLDIHMMWVEGNMMGFYQTLSFRNNQAGKENKKYKPSPIQWR